jgi:hypothetical protein
MDRIHNNAGMLQCSKTTQWLGAPGAASCGSTRKVVLQLPKHPKLNRLSLVCELKVVSGNVDHKSPYLHS